MLNIESFISVLVFHFWTASPLTVQSQIGEGPGQSELIENRLTDTGNQSEDKNTGGKSSKIEGQCCSKKNFLFFLTFNSGQSELRENRLTGIGHQSMQENLQIQDKKNKNCYTLQLTIHFHPV